MNKRLNFIRRSTLKKKWDNASFCQLMWPRLFIPHTDPPTKFVYPTDDDICGIYFTSHLFQL